MPHTRSASSSGTRAPNRDPGQEQRGARGLPELDLQQSQPRRAPVGAPQGMARIATRYEKTARSFMGVLCLAATFDWIKKDFKL